jgi:SlyX protein
MTVDERLIEVEIRAAHLEKLVGDLSEVIYQQQKELDQLRAVVGQLREKLSADPGLVDGSRDDKPPHY